MLNMETILLQRPQTNIPCNILFAEEAGDIYNLLFWSYCADAPVAVKKSDGTTLLVVVNTITEKTEVMNTITAKAAQATIKILATRKEGEFVVNGGEDVTCQLHLSDLVAAKPFRF